MLDAPVVALIVFAVRTSGIATALSQAGLYFFTASVAMTVLAAAMVPRGPVAHGLKERSPKPTFR